LSMHASPHFHIGVTIQVIALHAMPHATHVIAALLACLCSLPCICG
jgi:hypothetical protein